MRSLLWQSCTDAAASMTGKKSGAVTGVRKLHQTLLLCIIHREAMAAKNMEESLEKVMSTFIKF